MDYSSKLLARAVDEIAQLPGIGKRSALRLALHLLKQPQAQTKHLTEALMALRSEINFCAKCHNLSDQPLCEICANPKRDATILCVVEDIRDVMAIESTSQFKGDELEYTDALTLGRSIQSRLPYEEVLRE